MTSFANWAGNIFMGQLPPIMLAVRCRVEGATEIGNWLFEGIGVVVWCVCGTGGAVEGCVGVVTRCGGGVHDMMEGHDRIAMALLASQSVGIVRTR
jgi:hypothetical protein